MPYYKRYSKKRKYGYGSTIRNMKMTRKFKASAANMTQNGRFNISARTTMTFTVNSGTSNTWGYVNVANTVLASDMHKQLSSVFDQYRIDKVSIKFRPAINTANPVSNSVPYVTFFTCVDRTGFNSANMTLAILRTYGSYRESSFSTTGDLSKPHYLTIGQSGLIGKSTYYDTKAASVFPNVCCGIDLGSNATSNFGMVFAIEIDAQVRYRGVRYDPTQVRTV